MLVISIIIAAVTLLIFILTLVISIAIADAVSCVPIIHDIEYLRVQFVIVLLFF